MLKSLDGVKISIRREDHKEASGGVTVHKEDGVKISIRRRNCASGGIINVEVPGWSKNKHQEGS
jgi:hypothetical protein